MVKCFVLINLVKLLFIKCFILNGSMEGHADVYLHHSSRCIMDHVLSYVGGDVHIIENFDVDFMSIISVKNVYKSLLGYKNVENIYVLELGMEMNEGIFLILDDNGIRKVLSKKNSNTNVLEFFANHKIDALAFSHLTISYEIDPPIA